MHPIVSYSWLWMAYIAWCAAWVILQALALRHTFTLSWQAAVTDAFITNVIIAVVGYAMVTMMRFYRPRLIVRLGLSIGFAVLCTFSFQYLLPVMLSGEYGYDSFLERSLLIRGLYSWLMISLVSAMAWLWFTLREQQEAEGRSNDAERLGREAELSRLRQQLQPHFLFNSLNSISALAGSKPEEARKMIHQLSDFFRTTLKKDNQQMVPLSDELDHLTLYLEIEKVRFGHRLKTVTECDQEALSWLVPSLLLQPVVENAIKFGLYDTTGETVIRVSAKMERTYLILQVENPFDPATTPPRQGTGFGLNSIRRRLYLLYARNDLLSTSQTDLTYITRLKIPQQR